MKSLLFAVFLISIPAFSQKVKTKVIRSAYVNSIFVQLHQSPSKYSQPLTTFECGHPLKIYSKRQGSREQSVFNEEWYFTKSAGYEGYIRKDVVVKKRDLDCFNMKYPKFYDSMDISLSDMYYWGRLVDQYNSGRTTAISKE